MKWLWWTVGGIVVAGLLGGGYFAYSKGFIAIPFLTPKSDQLFSKMVDSISTITSAQYTVRANIEAQPRGNGKPLFDSATLNTNLPGGNGTLSLFNPKDLVKTIPGDIKVEGGMTIYVETDKLVQDANGIFKLDGTYTGSDTSVAIDLELRKVQKNLYGMVRKFPSFFLIDLSAVKNKWVVATPDDSVSEISTSTFENKDLRKSVDALKSATQHALDTKLFTVKQKLAPATIAGVRSEHYLLNVDPSKLVAVFETVRDEQRAKGENITSIEQSITDLKNPEIVKLLQAIADNSKIEIWIDKTKGLLRQVRWGLTVVPDDSIERLKGKQLFVGLTLTLDKVNQKVTVDKPSPTIDFDEATRLVTGITKEQQRFDKQTQRVSKIRSALTTYQTKNHKYPNSLAELNSSLKTISDQCLKDNPLTNANTSASPTALGDAQAKARDAQRKGDVALLQSALLLYLDDHQAYPTDLGRLVPTYTTTLPVDPTSKTNYSYQSCAGNHYLLQATLETTSDKFLADEHSAAHQSGEARACGSAEVNTNTTTTGPTSFSIESVGSSIGLGGYDASLYRCYDEKRYRNGVSVADMYTNKPYSYSLKGDDYELVYSIKLADAVNSYDKDSYADGKNTATSKDVSLEKTTSFEQTTQKNQTLLNANTNSNQSTNTSINYWTTLYPCLNGAPTTTGDADHDGLSDYDEVYKYSTNPCKADTDGDSYSDKIEVDGGYNPNGAGKATSIQLQTWGVSTTTSATAKPKILAQTVTTSGGQAIVTWSTDIDADAVVNYGQTTDYGQLVNNTTFTTRHGLTFSVVSGKSYHYAIRTCAQNLPAATGCTSSQDYTFLAK